MAHAVRSRRRRCRPAHPEVSLTIAPARPARQVVATHLTSAQVEELGRELDAIRQRVLDSRGARDAAYIRRVIRVQRGLELSSRVVLLAGRRRSAWWIGTASLSLAKVLDNMEIGHNVLHGQWDWMRDPQDPLHHLAVGPLLAAGPVAARAQRGPPPLHQHRRARQRPRLRRDAGRRGAGVEADPPHPAVHQLPDGLRVRVEHRDVRRRPRLVHRREARPVPRGQGAAPA